MKKYILVLGVSFLLLNSAKAQKYFGKSYAATKNVEEYYDSSDVKKGYSVMGRAEMDKGFRSIEKCQLKMIELAKNKGADAVIFSMEEEVIGTSNSGSATVHDKKKGRTTATTAGSSVNMKERKIKAIFIKYD